MNMMRIYTEAKFCIHIFTKKKIKEYIVNMIKNMTQFPEYSDEMFHKKTALLL